MPDEFGTPPPATAEEMLDTIRDAMWTVDFAKGDDLPSTPASRYLPDLKEALAKIQATYKEMLGAILPDAKRAVKMASNSTANPLWANADKYVEVNRLCTLQVAQFALEWAIDRFEQEGRAPTPVPHLPKTRRRTS